MSILFKRFKDWAVSIISFRTGDVIPVDGPSGTAKMGKDALLRETAQNALAGNVVPDFDPNKPNDGGGYAYYAGTSVAYLGKNYVFTQNHKSGPWNTSEVEQKPLSETIQLEGVGEAVNEWLDEHPEATTTVPDGSLTEQKLSDTLKLQTIKDYVTPEMFGAKGDGVTDDTDAIQTAIDFNKNKNNIVILLAENYLVKKGGLRLRNNVAIISQNGSTIKTDSKAVDADDSYGFMLGLSVADSDELHNRTGDWLHDVVISGITFDQSLETYINESTIDSSSKRMRPIFIYGVRNLRIYDCKFVLKGANAVAIGRLTSSNIFVENNIVENLTKSYNYDQSAIYVQGTFSHITSNTIADNVNTSSISPMRGGIEIHGYGFVVSDNVIKNVVSAFNISCYRGQIDRPDGMFNEVVNNQAYCTDFIGLWNQQALGIDPVALGYLNVNGNIAQCRRVCRTIYNVEHLSLTSDINFVGNVFYGRKLTNLSSRTTALDNAAIRFNFLAEAKNLKFANNVFSNFECCLLVVSADAGVEVSNIEIVNNVFNNCFSVDVSEIGFYDYSALFYISSAVKSSRINGNRISINPNPSYISIAYSIEGEVDRTGNYFDENYKAGFFSSAASLKRGTSVPTFGTYYLGDVIVTPRCNAYVRKSGTIKTGVLSGTLTILPLSYIELDNNTTADIEVGDVITLTSGSVPTLTTNVVAKFGNRIYISAGFEASLFGITESLTTFSFVNFETELYPIDLYVNSSEPSSPIRGRAFYSSSEKKPIVYDGYNWTDFDGVKVGLKKSGTTAQRPADFSYVSSGYEYFDTDLGKTIFFKERRAGYPIWVDSEGADVVYKRLGPTTERPVSLTYTDPLPQGFVYYDTTLNAKIMWNGSDWVNLNGTAL